MRNGRAAFLWVGAIAYAAAVFILSHQPVPTPAEGSVIVLGDKVLHVVEYAGLANLLALALGSIPRPALRSRAVLIAMAAAIAYAASDEFHQTLVGRVGDLTDFLADAAGAVLATVVYEAWRRRASRAQPVSDTSPR